VTEDISTAYAILAAPAPLSVATPELLTRLQSWGC